MRQDAPLERAPSTPMVSMEALTRRFGDRVVVDGLTLSVEAGEVFGLLGPNGAGKSTVIKMLATLLPPTAGTARVAGFALVRQAALVRRVIGSVPQLLSADGALTGYENLLVFARLSEIPHRQREQRVHEALACMNLEEMADRLVSTYSGGMIRRLEIAQATLHRPQVLFLDEPTVGLDPLAREVVWEHLEGRRPGDNHFSDHASMDEAEKLCARVAIMHLGKIAALGTPRELKASVGGAHVTMDEVFVHYAGGTLEAGGSVYRHLFWHCHHLGARSGHRPHVPGQFHSSHGAGAGQGTRGRRARALSGGHHVPAGAASGRAALLESPGAAGRGGSRTARGSLLFDLLAHRCLPGQNARALHGDRTGAHDTPLLRQQCHLPSARDIWAVGNVENQTTHVRTTLVEAWDGALWQLVPSPNPSSLDNVLSGVSAVSASDIWAVGTQANATGVATLTLVEHWNGTSWQVIPSPSPASVNNELFSVTAVSATDLWAVGFVTTSASNQTLSDQTLIEHWNGSSWRVVKSPNPGTGSDHLSSVAAVSSTDVWAVGNEENSDGSSGTLIEHWNGMRWSVVPNPGSGGSLSSVAAVSTSDVWAAGQTITGSTVQTLIEHWNGMKRQVVASPNIGQHPGFLGITAVSATDVWAVGSYGTDTALDVTLTEHWNGKRLGCGRG